MHSKEKECVVLSGLVNTVNPSIGAIQASSIVPRNDNIYEAYDENKLLIGVFKRNQDNQYKRVNVNRCNPFQPIYKSYFKMYQPSVMEQFSSQMLIFGTEKILPAIKNVFGFNSI